MGKVKELSADAKLARARITRAVEEMRRRSSSHKRACDSGNIALPHPTETDTLELVPDPVNGGMIQKRFLPGAN